MTLLDPHLDLDQVSAAVDGERDAATAAHLLTCLACREQVDAWRRALAPLRDLPAPPADVDGIIEAALATWTAPPASQPAPIRAAGPTPRTPAWRRLRPPPSVAAALVVAALLVGAIAGLRSIQGGSSVASSSAKSTGAPAVPAAGRSSGAIPPAPQSTTSLSWTSQLVAQLRRVGATGPGHRVAATVPCLHQARVLASHDPAVTVGSSPSFAEVVQLAGVRSRVFVFPAAPGNIAVVVRSQGCSLLATVRF